LFLENSVSSASICPQQYAPEIELRLTRNEKAYYGAAPALAGVITQIQDAAVGASA